jgi:hypothetical protein
MVAMVRSVNTKFFTIEIPPDGFTALMRFPMKWDWLLSMNSQGKGRVALGGSHGSRKSSDEKGKNV